MSEQTIDFEQVEAMGISRQAFDEVLDIIGRQPTIDELSTLLAMWEANGKQQSLYGWLRGQHHVVERNDYLYDGSADHRAIREPKVKECVEIARTLCKNLTPATSHFTLNTGTLLYMVGNVSSEFADSDYARRCLHLVDQPMATGGHEEDRQYIEMILTALSGADLLSAHAAVGQGGVFCSLLRFTSPLGFDILTPREVRLDKAGRLAIVPSSELYDNRLVKNESSYVSYDNGRLRVVFEKRTIFDKAYASLPDIETVEEAECCEAFLNGGVDNITVAF